MVGLLFPEPPRSFPGRRAVKIALRALHVLCVGVLTGSHVLGADPAESATWLRWTIGSGCLLLALDLHESGAFLLQVRGAFVLLKVAALAAMPLLGHRQVWLLCALLLLSVVMSHAPSKVRYFVLVGRGRVAAARTKG